MSFTGDITHPGIPLQSAQGFRPPTPATSPLNNGPGISTVHLPAGGGGTPPAAAAAPAATPAQQAPLDVSGPSTGPETMPGKSNPNANPYLGFLLNRPSVEPDNTQSTGEQVQKEVLKNLGPVTQAARQFAGAGIGEQMDTAYYGDAEFAKQVYAQQQMEEAQIRPPRTTLESALDFGATWIAGPTLSPEFLAAGPLATRFGGAVFSPLAKAGGTVLPTIGKIAASSTAMTALMGGLDPVAQYLRIQAGVQASYSPAETFAAARQGAATGLLFGSVPLATAAAKGAVRVLMDAPKGPVLQEFRRLGLSDAAIAAMTGPERAATFYTGEVPESFIRRFPENPFLTPEEAKAHPDLAKGPAKPVSTTPAVAPVTLTPEEEAQVKTDAKTAADQAIVGLNQTIPDAAARDAAVQNLTGQQPQLEEMIRQKTVLQKAGFDQDQIAAMSPQELAATAKAAEAGAPAGNPPTAAAPQQEAPAEPTQPAAPELAPEVEAAVTTQPVATEPPAVPVPLAVPQENDQLAQQYVAKNLPGFSVQGDPTAPGGSALFNDKGQIVASGPTALDAVTKGVEAIKKATPATDATSAAVAKAQAGAGTGPAIPGTPGRPIEAFTPETAPAPTPNARAGLFLFDPRDLQVDAERFQFKSGGDQQGVTPILRQVTQWDQDAAGQLVVWQDADGKLYVADGHQRVALANRLLDRGAEQKILMPASLYRAADGFTSDDAMVIAAMKNIREGSGDIMDAAKVLRLQPDEINKIAQIGRAQTQQAVALTRLDDNVWRMATNGVITPGEAATVGRLIPEDAALQNAAATAIAKLKPASQLETELLVGRVKESDLVASINGSQGSLLDELNRPESTVKEEVGIVSRVIQTLAKDKNTLTRVAKNQTRIESVGNKIAREATMTAAEASGRLSALVEKVSFSRGDQRSALLKLAKEVKSGERSLNDATEAYIAALKSFDRPGFAGRGEPGAGGATDETGGQGLFGSEGVGPGTGVKPVEQARQEAVRIGTGTVLQSVSGRQLDPAPKIDVSTNQRAANTLKRVDQWLWSEAQKELEGQGVPGDRVFGTRSQETSDYQLGLVKGMDPKKLSPSDRDILNTILFGSPDGATAAHMVEGEGPQVKEAAMIPPGSPWDENRRQFGNMHAAQAWAEKLGIKGAVGKLAAGDHPLPDGRVLRLRPAESMGMGHINSRIEAEILPAPEPGAEGKPQLVLPGAEQISQAQLAARRAAQPLQAKAAQNRSAGPLFSDEAQQLDLVDMAKAAGEPTAVTQRLAVTATNPNAPAVRGPDGSAYRIKQGPDGGFYGMKMPAPGEEASYVTAPKGSKWTLDDAVNEVVKRSTPLETAPIELPTRGLPDKAVEALNDPVVTALLNRPYRIVRAYPIAYLAGYSNDGSTIYIHNGLPEQFNVKRLDGGPAVKMDPTPFLVLHERVEKALIDSRGYTYQGAHQIAVGVEHAALREAGWDETSYESNFTGVKQAAGEVPLEAMPQDLDMVPYRDTDRKIPSKFEIPPKAGQPAKPQGELFMLPPKASYHGPEMPALARAAGDNGEAIANSASERPPGSQPLSPQDSTRPVPSGSSTTREMPPSTKREGGVTTFNEGSLGTAIGKWNVWQGGEDFKALMDRAKANAPTVKAKLDTIVNEVPGTRLFGVRPKTLEGIQGKLDEGRPPWAISDYLGARVWADSGESMQAVIDRLGQDFRVLQIDNFLQDTRGGYRAIHVQVGLGDGTSAEVQVVPTPIAKVQETLHAIYDQFKRTDPKALTAEQLAAYKAAKETVRQGFDAAWQDAGGDQAFTLDHIPPGIVDVPKAEPAAPEAPAAPEPGQPGTAEHAFMGYIRRGRGVAPGELARPAPGVPEAAGTAHADALGEISDRFRKALGLTVREGRIAPRPGVARGKQPLAVYKTASGVIRMKDMNDFDVMAHEAGHDFHLNPVMKGDIDRLINAHLGEVQTMAPAGYPAAQTNQEGFAEWFRTWITNPAYAAKHAPGFTADFQRWMETTQPRTAAEIKRVQDEYSKWLFAPSKQLVSGDIVTSGAPTYTRRLKNTFGNDKLPTGESLFSFFDRFYTWAFNSKNPVFKVANGLVKVFNNNHPGQNLDLKMTESPGHLAQMADRAMQAGHMDLLYGVTPYRGGIDGTHIYPEGPSLAAAIELVAGKNWFGKWRGDDLTDLGGYLAARRMVQEWDRYKAGEIPNPPGKFSQADYATAIKDYEASNPNLAVSAKMIYVWIDNLLQKGFDGGLLSKEYVDAARSRADYAPLNRDFSDTFDEALGEAKKGGGTGGNNKYSVMKAFRGSTRAVINPIESLIQRAYLYNSTLARNDVIRSIAALADKAGPDGGVIAERIPATQMRGAGFELFDALKTAGKEQGLNPMEVDDLLLQAEARLGTDEFFSKVYRPAPINEAGEPIVYYWEGGQRQALRLGDNRLGQYAFEALTGIGHEQGQWWLNLLGAPMRWLRVGIVSDPSFAAAVWIKDQMLAYVLNNRYVPFISGIKGFAEEYSGARNAKLYAYSGGVMGGSQVASLDESRFDRDITALQRKGYNIQRMKDPRELLKISESSITATRVAAFGQYYRKAIGDGLTPYEAMTEAAYEASDVTDFGRSGSKTLLFRRTITFVNAALQGGDKIGRTLFADLAPMGKVFKGEPLTRIEKAHLARSAGAWARVGSLMAGSATLAALSQNDPEYQDASDYLKTTSWLIKLPGGGWVAIPKPFQLAVFTNLAERMVDAISQKDPTAMNRWVQSLSMTLAPPMAPPGLAVPIELSENKDFSSGRQIVSSTELGLDPAQQFNAYTSEFSKTLGKSIGVSPDQVDFLLAGWGGSWARDLLNLSNMTNPARQSQALYDWPITARFVKNLSRGSDPTDKFYGLISATGGRLDAKLNTYKDLIKTGNPDAAAQYFGQLADDEKAWVASQTSTDPMVRKTHPLARGDEMLKLYAQLEREVVERNVKPVYGGKQAKPLVFNPTVAKQINDQLTRASAAEARNAMIAVGEPGWAGRQYMDPQPFLDQIRALSPAIYKELQDRTQKAQVQPFKGVAAVWPTYQRRLVSQGIGGFASDLAAVASIAHTVQASQAVAQKPPVPQPGPAQAPAAGQ